MVPQYPNTDFGFSCVVEKMIWESSEIASAQSAGVKVEKAWVRRDLFDSSEELCIEIIRQGFGYSVVVFKGLVKVGLNPAMEPNFHEYELLLLTLLGRSSRKNLLHSLESGHLPRCR